MQDGGERLYFDAELRPSKSLSPEGFQTIMIGAGVLSLFVGYVFWQMGAWPVIGFFGLDVLALYLAFKFSNKNSGVREHVRLTDSRFEIIRIEADGARKDWSFEPYWVKVSIERPGTHRSTLAIASHGKVLHLGTFLPPDERVDLGNALISAFTSWRSKTTASQPV